jgi:hypothetical protein
VSKSKQTDGLPEAVRRIVAAVDPGRVSARLEALAQIGAQPDGGITCTGFSDEEAEANALFCD